jgi:hypothetical protein
MTTCVTEAASGAMPHSGDHAPVPTIGKAGTIDTAKMVFHGEIANDRRLSCRRKIPIFTNHPGERRPSGRRVFIFMSAAESRRDDAATLAEFREF